MRLIITFFSCVFLTSCGSADVDYDFDRDYDFSEKKTYAFEAQPDAALSEFDDRRFRNYTTAQLLLKGYEISETPELVISYDARLVEAPSRNTLGVSVGGGGGNVGVGVSGGIPVGPQEEQLELHVAVIDLDRNEIVWEATSYSTLPFNSPPPKRDAHFEKLTDKIFKKFPPEKR